MIQKNNTLEMKLLVNYNFRNIWRQNHVKTGQRMQFLCNIYCKTLSTEWQFFFSFFFIKILSHFQCISTFQNDCFIRKVFQVVFSNPFVSFVTSKILPLLSFMWYSPYRIFRVHPIFASLLNFFARWGKLELCTFFDKAVKRALQRKFVMIVMDKLTPRDIFEEERN